MPSKYGEAGKASPGKKGKTETHLHQVKENKCSTTSSSVQQDGGPSEVKAAY